MMDDLICMHQRARACILPLNLIARFLKFEYLKNGLTVSPDLRYDDVKP